MSVLKSKRSVSNIQFLTTARELQVYIIRQVVKFPKRYTFLLNNKIADLATEIFTDSKRANTIYPTNQHELQKRIDYIDNAIANLYNLISMLDLAKEIFGVEDKIMIHSMALITEELKLLKSLKKSDKERYKNL